MGSNHNWPSPPPLCWAASGTGTGAPEAISVGSNLSFNAGTISATASPFMISQLPSGMVPATGDLVSVSQGGTNAAVTYGQLLNGFSGVPNVDVSQALVTPSGSLSGQTLASLTAKIMPLLGGSLTGTTILVGDPTVPTQAANKSYVDQQISTALPLAGGSLSGVLSFLQRRSSRCIRRPKPTWMPGSRLLFLSPEDLCQAHSCSAAIPPVHYRPLRNTTLTSSSPEPGIR